MDTFDLYRRVLADLGVALTAEHLVLDWGCGAGSFVAQGRAAGFNVSGCDFDTDAEHCSRIERPYRLPFADASIDVITSGGVLEHCRDYDTSLRELARVLKPGGAFLHLFPSRWAVIEPHAFVPFAGRFHNPAWLLLWSMLGIRSQFQTGRGVIGTLQHNREFFGNYVNYLPQRQIAELFARQFTEIRFAEDVFLKNSPSAKGRALYQASHVLPFIPWAYRKFRSYVLFGRH